MNWKNKAIETSIVIDFQMLIAQPTVIIGLECVLYKISDAGDLVEEESFQFFFSGQFKN